MSDFIKRFTICSCFAFFCVCLSGCNVIGLLLSPAAQDEKIPAEFDISSLDNGTILIFADSDGSSAVPFTVRNNLAQMIEAYLIKKTSLKKQNFISQKELSDYLINSKTLSKVSFLEAAAELQANAVLYVLVGDYSFSAANTGSGNFYKGVLVTYSSLYDVKSSNKLWPAGENSKKVKNLVQFFGSAEQIETRLVSAAAYCISRYLYNCKASKFRIHDEVSEYNPDKW